MMKDVISLARNKKVQQAAINTGYNLGLAAAKKIQARRTRKRRTPIMRNIQNINPRAILGSSGNVVTTTTAAPLRTNTTITGTPRVERVIQTEVSGLKIVGAVTGSSYPAAGILVSVDNTSLWPMLVDKAQNFSAYTVLKLRMLYQASKGSAYNGQITVGFTRDPLFTRWDDASAVFNLPVKARFQASSTDFAFDIPVSTMAQGGRDLWNAAMLGKTDTMTEPTRYYAGQFGWNADSCTDTTEMGTWHTQYIITLQQSQLNLNPAQLSLTSDGAGNITLIDRGRYSPRIVGTDLLAYSVRPSVLMVYGSHGSREVTLDGVSLTPDLVATEFAFFNVPKLRGEKLAFPGSSITGAVLWPGMLSDIPLPTPPPVYATTTFSAKK